MIKTIKRLSITRALIMGAFGWCSAVPAFAADHDFQSWTSANVTVDVGKRFAATMAGHLRLSDNASRAGQILLRPSIGYKLDSTTMLSLGYAYVFTDPVGPAQTDEHRLWQQISFRLAGDGKGFTVTGRARMEERWIEGRNGTGWRFRSQIRATAPVSGKVRIFAHSEPFIALNDTNWGQRSGLDRWRNAAGISVPVTKSITIEPAYLNQWVVVRGRDRDHHIANVTLVGRF